MPLNIAYKIFTFSLLLIAHPATGAWQSLNKFQWKNIHLRSSDQAVLHMMGGEGFQQLMDIEYAPSNPNIIYFTTDTSQVWKSTNGGTTWKPVHNGLRAIGGLSLLIDKNNPDRAFLAGFTAKDTDASGIYLTENGGEVWTRVFDRAGYRKNWLVRGQDLFIQHNNEFIAATQNGKGLLISQDGREWSPIEFDSESDIQNDQLGMILNLEVNPHTSDLEIWISSYSGLYKLTESANSDNHFHCDEISSATSGLPNLFTGWRRGSDPDGITTFLDSTEDSDFNNPKVSPSSLRLDFNNSPEGYWHTRWGQTIPVTPGIEYTISGKVMLRRDNDNDQGGIFISAVDDDDRTTRWPTNVVHSNTIENDRSVWVDINGTFTPSGDTSHIRVVLQRLKNESVSGSAWFDNIKLYRSDQPETNLLRSTDIGDTDDFAAFHGDTPTAIHFGSTPDEIIVSAGLHGIYKSIDGGDSFEPSNEGLPVYFMNKKRINLDGSRYNRNVLVAGFSQAGGTNFISTDSGNTWNKIDICSINNKNILNDIHPEERLHINYWATPTGFHPKNQYRMIHAFEGSIIFRSLHRGSDADSTCDSDDIHHWNYSSDGYSGGRAGGGFAFGNDRNPRTTHFFLTDHGPYVTHDGGRAWKRLVLPNSIGSNNASAGDVSGNRIVASIGPWRANAYQQIVRSSNGGESWSIERNNRREEGTVKYRFIAFDPVNPGTVYADNYYSTNYGWSWFELPELAVDGESQDRILTVVGISPTTGAIYAKDKDTTNTLSTTQIWRSTNRGNEWTPIASNSISARPNQVTNFAISPSNDFNVYAVTTNNGVYRLEEQNGLWEQHNLGITNDIPDTPWNQYGTKYITIDPVHNNVIYIGKNASPYGQSDGVFVSTDSGDSWENISKNLGQDSTIWGLEVNPNNDTLYVASSLGTWAMSPLALNYHFDGSNSEFTVFNDSIYSIDTNDSELGDGLRGTGTSIVTDGLAGRYLYFNGSIDAYVELPTYTTALKSINNYYSVEAMVRIDSDASLQNGPIIIDKNQYNQPGGFLLRSWHGHITFSGSSNTDSSLQRLAQSTTRLEKNTWYHVVATFSHGRARLFINGREEDNNIDNVVFENSSLQPSGSLLLGASQINTTNLQGAIDEVRIYNRVLSRREVRNRYNHIFQN